MRHGILVLALALCMPTPLWAAAAPPPTQLAEVEGIHEYRLANGLQVLLIPDASQPKVTVNVTYRVGSRMESYGETGMAHLLEHLMFKSTRHMANLGAELSRRGMQFNGSTTIDRTNYFETFPADAVQLAWALRTEAERMTGANVVRRDLDSEMTVVRNEMEAGENEPLNVLVEKSMAAAYQWHSYGKGVIGARSDVEHVNIAHLQAFYRRYYQPDNATLVVAGAFDAPRVLADIASVFGALPKPQRVLEAGWTVEPVQEGERTVTLRRQGGLQGLYLGYHVPGLTGSDFAALEVVANALGNTPSGRLHRRLVEPGKATEVAAWTLHSAEPGLLNLFVALNKGDSLEQAESVLLGAVEGLAAEPVTAAELERAQQQAARDFELTMGDSQRLCLALSESIAAGDWRLLFLQRDRMAALTLAEVNATAGTWLKASNRTLGRFIPTDSPERTPLPGQPTAAQALKDFKPRATLVAGEAFDAGPASIDRRTRRITLPSGLKLALLPKKTRGETVKVQVRLDFGTAQALRGQRTAGEQLLRSIASGTQHHTRAQIHDRANALKSEFSVTGRAWQVQASLGSTRSNLAAALDLTAEVLREPAIPASEFEQQVHNQLGELAQAATDPTALGVTALWRGTQSYEPDDVRYSADFGQQAELVKALPREALATFHERFWGADHGEIAVVGDFDADAVQAQLTRLFGDWVSASPYERLPIPGATKQGLHLVTQVPDKANAFILGTLSLPLQDTDPDYPALVVAAQVLGGGTFESRLVTRLRQKEGLSYGAGAALQASDFEPHGSLDFYAIFAPQNRARVEQAFAEELARFTSQGITAAELAAARQSIAASARTDRANDAGVAEAWTHWLQAGRSYAFAGDLEARIAALTLEQVDAAIRKWLDPAAVNWSLAGAFD
jgi:zinc protease